MTVRKHYQDGLVNKLPTASAGLSGLLLAHTHLALTELPTMPAPPDLPSEVLANILSQASQHDLSTCCRVSKAVKSIAAPLLHTHMRITVDDRTIPLFESLDAKDEQPRSLFLQNVHKVATLKFVHDKTPPPAPLKGKKGQRRRLPMFSWSELAWKVADQLIKHFQLFTRLESIYWPYNSLSGPGGAYVRWMWGELTTLKTLKYVFLTSKKESWYWLMASYKLNCWAKEEDHGLYRNNGSGKLVLVDDEELERYASPEDV